MYKKQSIGAFYQCYKRPKAVESVLLSFRRFYPNSDIYLICDGGDDFSKTAEKYNCKYRYVENKGNGTNNIFDSVEKIADWVIRLRIAANNIKEDYILLLEDDVLILGEIEEKLKYTISGVNKDTRMGFWITQFLKLHNWKIPFWRKSQFWGGFGGCLIEKQFILDHFNNIYYDLERLTNLSKHKVYSTDVWVSILTLYHGGTLGQYKGLCETWWKDYPKRLKKGDIKILHQYKDLY